MLNNSILTALSLLAALGCAYAVPMAKESPLSNNNLYSRDDQSIPPSLDDDWFGDCYRAPNCDVEWSENPGRWRMKLNRNWTEPTDALGRRQNPEPRTQVRVSHQKTSWGGDHPSSVMHNVLYNRCDDEECRKWDVWEHQSPYSVFVRNPVQSPTTQVPTTTRILRITCDGEWMANWERRDANAEFIKAAIGEGIEEKWYGNDCEFQQGPHGSERVCRPEMTEYEQVDNIRISTWNQATASSMGFLECWIEPETDRWGTDCGMWGNLAGILTGLIPGIGPWASAALGFVNSARCHE